MAKKYEMLVFHADTVNSDSVGMADDGASLDMAAFKAEDLICITAGNTSVELTFDETGLFNRNFGNGGADGGDAGGEAIENSLAILTVTDAATAVAVVKKIVQGINAQSPVYNDGLFLFDAVNDTYPCGINSSEVSAINIRRTTSTRATTAA